MPKFAKLAKPTNTIVPVQEHFKNEDDWVEYGKKLAATERGIGWLIGAWWNAGERYGYRVERARECGFRPKYCRDCGWAVSKVSFRQDTLSFKHHTQVAALPPPEQREWLLRAEKGDGGGKQWSAMTLRRELRKTEARKVVSLNGRYRVIYADPPWKYSDKMEIATEAGGESYGAAQAHYSSMTIEELCEMKVKDIAGDNSILFLWVTAPLLEDAFKVIAAWGFKYKTNFVWDKIKHNMGHYSSVRHEHLLVAVRGQCTPDENKLFDSVQSIERKDHSRKPEEFRGIIDTLYTHGNKIELFARGEKVSGWRKWGDQADVRSGGARNKN